MSSPQSKDKLNIANILRLVANDIAAAFPLLIGFYVFALVLSLWSATWQRAIYWPGFHLSVIVFGVIALTSERVRSRGFIRYLREALRGLYARVTADRRYCRGLVWRSLVSAAAIGLTMYWGAGPLDVAVLTYALAAILFSRIDAGLTIGLGLAAIAASALFYMFGNNALANGIIIYAYYLLVIALISQVVYFLNGNKAELSTSEST